MGWTKRDFIAQAYEEIGLAQSVFDLSPEQLQSALRKLDAMMATWNARGLRLGYPLPSSPGDSELTTDTEVPDRANEAIYTNLAIRLASAVGRPVSDDLKRTAKQAYDALVYVKASDTPARQMPSGMPAGAGHKRVDQPFLDPPEDAIDVGADGELDLD